MKQHKQNKVVNPEAEHDMVQMSFGTLVVDKTTDQISSVHQFHSVGIFVYVPGGTLGLKLAERYQVAIDDFQPQKLTNLIKADLEKFNGDPEATTKRWFESFMEEIRQAIYSYAVNKHGPLCRVYANEAQAELDVNFFGAVLEITPTDFTIAFTSRRRNGRSMTSLSMILGRGLGFISQPEDPEFSAQGDFGWEDAQGSYVYKNKKYLFRLSFENEMLTQAGAFNIKSFQVSLRKALNAAIKDVTNQHNAIEKLELF